MDGWDYGRRDDIELWKKGWEAANQVISGWNLEKLMNKSIAHDATTRKLVQLYAGVICVYRSQEVVVGRPPEFHDGLVSHWQHQLDSVITRKCQPGVPYDSSQDSPCTLQPQTHHKCHGIHGYIYTVPSQRQSICWTASLIPNIMHVCTAGAIADAGRLRILDVQRSYPESRTQAKRPTLLSP
ncbi:hypothetical protein E2P81_ATG03242 [Venturia nashicola]|nr:hypothetical protein E2P81_ATG03242 [Venturia nashicola]